MDLSVFVLGIIKGLKEHNDGTRHFGSTAAYGEWLQSARLLGVVEADSLVLTGLGEEMYRSAREKLSKHPEAMIDLMRSSAALRHDPQSLPACGSVECLPSHMQPCYGPDEDE